MIFDWDSTLVDNWDTLTFAMNAALREFDIPEWTRDQMIANSKLSLRNSFPQIFGGNWEKAGEIFYGYYGKHHLRGLNHFPPAPALLDLLLEHGIRMAICTNKKGAIARAEVKHLGWAKYFVGVVGAQDAEHDKPDPAPVNLILRASAMEPGPHAWFVGDMPTDMQCAHRAGCYAVGIGPDSIGNPEFPPHVVFPELGSLLTGIKQLLS